MSLTANLCAKFERNRLLMYLIRTKVIQKMLFTHETYPRRCRTLIILEYWLSLLTILFAKFEQNRFIKYFISIPNLQGYFCSWDLNLLKYGSVNKKNIALTLTMNINISENRFVGRRSKIDYKICPRQTANEIKEKHVKITYIRKT